MKPLNPLRVALRLRNLDPKSKRMVNQLHMGSEFRVPPFPTSSTFPHLPPYYPSTQFSDLASLDPRKSRLRINGSMTLEIFELKTQEPEEENVYPFLCLKTGRIYLSQNEYILNPKYANRRNLTIHDVQPNLYKLPNGFHPFYTDLTMLP